MRKVLSLTLFSVSCAAFIPSEVSALVMTAPHPLKPQVAAARTETTESKPQTTGVKPQTAAAKSITTEAKPQSTQALPKFTFTDQSGKRKSVDIVTQFQPDKITRPVAKVDGKIDPKLMRAATIAQERARAHSHSRCWHYVKEALVAAGVVSSRPKTEYAKQAGQELVSNYGFKKLPVRDPYQAPVGSVLVYDAKRSAGHVEIRTKDGFVSDFRSKTPSRRPLLGVFIKG